MTFDHSAFLPLRAAAMAGLFGWIAPAAIAQDIQSQDDLTARIEAASPELQDFIKDQPILGWQLNSADLAELPAAISEHLGGVDSTGYDAAYLEANTGSIVALQMTGEGPDFYIIGLDTYMGSYTEVPLADVAEKNARLIERLEMVPDVFELFETAAPGMVGALKTEPVQMIVLSDIGYATDEEVTIQAPWGTQTKPAGADAFLVWDSGESQYYMVNADADGLPISYVPVP